MVRTRLPTASQVRDATTSLAESAAVRRHLLSREWLRSSQAGVLAGAPPAEAKNWVARERRAGRILGVWVPDEHDYRYPSWQFGPDGKPIPQFIRALAIVREHDRLAVGRQAKPGWSEAAWFLAPHALLESETPAHWLAMDPDRVLAVAHREFIEEGNDFW